MAATECPYAPASSLSSRAARHAHVTDHVSAVGSAREETRGAPR